MREIKLTKGYVALVDDDDYELLSKYKWTALERGTCTYAVTMVTMHRLIKGEYKNTGALVDHIDGNGLNNQKQNLRLANRRENTQNRRKAQNKNGKPFSSQYKGVSFESNKWRSKIVVDGKKINLGRFENELDAAKAYDTAAIKYFGSFAKLNLT